MCGAEALFRTEVFPPDIGHVRERQVQLIENVGKRDYQEVMWVRLRHSAAPRLYALTR